MCAFVDSDVLPAINDYRDHAEFPWALVPKPAGLGVVGSTIEGYGRPGLSCLAAGMVTVEMSRGDGLLLENHVARHLTDMEVVHTYEGTDNIQALLVGRDITGISAFVRRRYVRPVPTTGQVR
jgi:Acyl-CoA dehydrogenase, N-terminal domain